MERKSIYSETVRGEFRTYFFDLKKSEKGNPYLLITESRKSKEAEGEFERSRILVLNADFSKFSEALHKALEQQEEPAKPE